MAPPTSSATAPAAPSTTSTSTTGPVAVHSLSEVRANLPALNQALARMSPRETLQWLQRAGLPNVVRFTSFGLSGMVITHLMHELGFSAPTVFIDTLHHFQETLDLKDIVVSRYDADVRVYSTREAATAAEFKAKFGELWKTAEDEYQHIVKIEPTVRAFRELDVEVWITGRRRSQGDAREGMQVLEFDEEGRLKVNPLAWMSFNDVNSFVKANNLPYNALLDRGYKSIGDHHSTVPVAADAPERSGRWKGSQKSECGIHNRPAHIQRKLDLRRKMRRLSNEQAKQTIPDRLELIQAIPLDSLENSLELEEMFAILALTGRGNGSLIAAASPSSAPPSASAAAANTAPAAAAIACA